MLYSKSEKSPLYFRTRGKEKKKIIVIQRIINDDKIIIPFFYQKMI